MEVAQDEAYWEFKNKFANIKQNMMELHMINENAYMKYQEELLRRPKILNIVHNTLEITKILMDHYEGLTGTLIKCRATKDTLRSEIQESAQWMQDLTLMQLKDAERQKFIDTLQDKLRVGVEQRAELLQQISTEEATGQQANAEVRELKEKLEAALREKKHAANNVMEQTQKLYLSDFVIKNLPQESNTQNVRTTRAAVKRKHLKQANESARKKILKKILAEIEIDKDQLSKPSGH